MKNLSTRPAIDKESPVKQILIDVNKLPTYLTKRNESFRQVIHQALSIMGLSAAKDNMDRLRKIAVSIYQMMFIQAYHALWTTYLTSGRGQLIRPSTEQVMYAVNLPIWPKEITRLVRSTKTKGVNEEEVCLQLVEHALHGLAHQLQQYQTELNIKAHTITNYTLTVHKMIETYIRQNLCSFRMNIEHQIELVSYDYHIQALKLEYERQHPTALQVCLFDSHKFTPLSFQCTFI